MQQLVLVCPVDFHRQCQPAVSPTEVITVEMGYQEQKCRSAQDEKWNIQVTLSLRAGRQFLCRGTPLSVATATAIPAFAVTPTANSLTAFRTRLQNSAGCRTYALFASLAIRPRVRLPGTTRLVLHTSLADNG